MGPAIHEPERTLNRDDKIRKENEEFEAYDQAEDDNPMGLIGADDTEIEAPKG